MIADSVGSTSDALATLGVPGLVAVILVLAGVIIYIYRAKEKLQDKYDTMLEKRVIDAKETRDTLVKPVEDLGDTSKKMYELLQVLLNGSTRGR